jgi:hypothetical protein
MSVAPLEFAFRLRNDMTVSTALPRMVEAVKKYRGFELHENDLPADRFSCIHQEYEFDFYGLAYLSGLDPKLKNIDKILVILTDFDNTMTDEGESNPGFWQALGNIQALVVAELDPLFGILFSSENFDPTSIATMDEALNGGGYFSNYYINERLPRMKEYIIQHSTRELKYGYLVQEDLLSERTPEGFNLRMGFD